MDISNKPDDQSDGVQREEITEDISEDRLSTDPDDSKTDRSIEKKDVCYENVLSTKVKMEKTENEETENLSHKKSTEVTDIACKDILVSPETKSDSQIDNSMTEDKIIIKTEPEDSAEISDTQNFMDEPYRNYDNIEVKVIEVPEDDDLFDFQSQMPSALDDILQISEVEEKKTEEELSKSELYRYLTEQVAASLSQSTEQTPCQSDEERRSESGHSVGSESSGGGFDSSDEEQASQEPQSVVESHQVEPVTIPDKETQLDETPVQRRRGKTVKPKSTKLTRKQRNQRGQISEQTLARLEKSREVTEKWLKDLEVPENLTFTQRIKLNIGELNQYLTCGICKGYLYEASTITECMHTFCKNCIVRHCMEVSLHCPVCHILIHPTDPFVNIRLDRMIQDIVYKLLPSVADREMKNIQDFYEIHPEEEPPDVKEPIPGPEISPKEIKEEPEYVEERGHRNHLVSLVLEAEGEEPGDRTISNKYIRVTNSATIKNVSNFLRKKLELDDDSKVDLFCCGDMVEDSMWTLSSIQDRFFPEQDNLILLQYRVQEG